MVAAPAAPSPGLSYVGPAAGAGHELTVARKNWPPGTGHRAAAGLGRVGSRSRISCLKRRRTAPFRAVAGAAATALSGKSHRHTAFSLLQLAGSKEVTL
jgi:hypothetical protein